MYNYIEGIAEMKFGWKENLGGVEIEKKSLN